MLTRRLLDWDDILHATSTFSLIADSISELLGAPFLMIVDECQIAANTFPSAFISNGVYQPLLQPFRFALSGTSSFYICLTGTGIYRDMVSQTYSSEHLKLGWTELFDLGGFDVRAVQEDYIAKFLFGTSRPWTLEQQCFLERCWNYLRGRQVDFVTSTEY